MEKRPYVRPVIEEEKLDLKAVCCVVNSGSCEYRPPGYQPPNGWCDWFNWFH